MYSLEQIADMLESARRTGADGDRPEGHRKVVISDSLARAFAASLRNHARGDPPNAVSVNHR